MGKIAEDFTGADSFGNEGLVYNDCVFEDEAELLQVGFLGFCGCGQPELALKYIHGGLALINRRSPDKREEWDAYYACLRADSLSHFGNEGGEYFFYYWADKEGLTEHGGSVPGWLTDKGKKLLSYLEELI